MSTSSRCAAVRALALLAVAGIAQAAAAANFSYIGQTIVPTGASYASTTVGGLSGIDYDAATASYVAISDDRSAVNPARYYTLSLDFNKFSRSNTPGSGGVSFSAVTTLRTAAGLAFGVNSEDAEAIRLVHGATGPTLLWTNEGQRSSAGFQSPTLREMKLDGSYLRDFSVPQTFVPVGTAASTGANDTGIRNNLAFESLTLSRDGKQVYIATESALAQDGPIATVQAGTVTRVAQFDYASGQRTAEYAYQLDAIPVAPTPSTSSADNGLVELLAVGDGRFLALERSFASGVGNNIRLYLTEIGDATNIAGISSLKGQSVTAMRKTLLLDLGSLTNDDGTALKLDNVEGISFGADVDGHQTLVLVSDNNFSSTQFTQFVALRIDTDLALMPVPEPQTAMLMALGLLLVVGVRRRR